MAKLKHEVRDAIYEMILFDNLDKKLIDSGPVQRMRNIHQLAMCYQVYPGATHKRFEHCLGVMDMATRMFDSIFSKDLNDEVRERVGEFVDVERKRYWRRVVRIAGLLHDVGHVPFSHASENLFPAGWNHERMTMEIISHSEIKGILEEDGLSPKIEDIIAVAIDVRKRKEEDANLTPWQTLLNEIITGNIFGADRIDYLLRDSWHAGVAYGRFDPIRLIEGLNVVIDPESEEIGLGLDYGSIHAAEALLLARFFMYTQVYFHDVRQAYDVHLGEFLQHWLPDGKFPTTWDDFRSYTDNKVLVALNEIAMNTNDSSQERAIRLINRLHFRTVYELIPSDKQKNPDVFSELSKKIESEFGKERVLQKSYGPKDEKNDFLVVPENVAKPVRAKEVSDVIKNIPALEFGYIFVDNSIKERAKKMVDDFIGKMR